MKQVYMLLIILFFSSCIPIRIAPNINDYKVQIGKRFRKTLPKTETFIFNDPKDEDEFYNYINTKFKLNHVNVEHQVPVILKGQIFYLSFYEARIPTKHLNMGKIATDVGLATKDIDPIFVDHYENRKDHWYIALKIEDSNFKNCLNSNHQNKALVLKYLKRLKNEYLNTHLYEEIHFRKTKIEEFKF